MPLYLEQFPAGSAVRVKPYPVLQDFRHTWRFHNPLSDEMLRFAGRETSVTAVGFYHGGDVLYTLEGIPGTWHESCLELVE